MNYEKKLLKTMLIFISRTWDQIIKNNNTINEHPDLDIIDKAKIELHIAYLQKACYLLDDICKEETGKSIIELAEKYEENENNTKYQTRTSKLD